VRACAYQPPNTYYPYLPTKAAGLVRILAPPNIGLFCVRPQVLAGLAPAVTAGVDTPFVVARCETRLNPNLRLDGNVSITAYGDDEAHVYGLHAELVGATDAGLRARLARAVVAAAGEPSPQGELHHWLVTADEIDDTFETRRISATLVSSEPSARAFAIESIDSETLGRFFGGLQPGNSLDAIAERILARAFAPTFVLAEGDYLPASLDVLPGRARLCIKRGSVERGTCRAFGRFPPKDALHGPPAGGGEWVLDLPPSERKPAAYERIEREVREAGSPPTVYWHVAKVGDYRRIVQYWIYYLFNDWENKHEGDWEAVMVDVLGWDSPGQATVLRWFYSAHERGRVGTCSSMGNCLHPHVYVARGSHANYFEPGRYEVTALCTKAGHCLVPPGEDVVPGEEELTPEDHELVELTPEDYELVELPDRPFPGRYGPVNAVPKLPDGDAPDDPRLHAEWNDDPLKKFVEAPGREPDPRRWFVIDVDAAAEGG
jgi:hypothetical protein